MKSDYWQEMLKQAWNPREHSDRDEHGESFMWVYRNTAEGFAVGFYDPEKRWNQDSVWKTAGEAALRVHYLNGGDRSEQEARGSRETYPKRSGG